MCSSGLSNTCSHVQLLSPWNMASATKNSQSCFTWFDFSEFKFKWPCVTDGYQTGQEIFRNSVFWPPNRCPFQYKALLSYAPWGRKEQNLGHGPLGNARMKALHPFCLVRVMRRSFQPGIKIYRRGLDVHFQKLMQGIWESVSRTGLHSNKDQSDHSLLLCGCAWKHSSFSSFVSNFLTWSAIRW